MEWISESIILWLDIIFEWQNGSDVWIGIQDKQEIYWYGCFCRTICAHRQKLVGYLIKQREKEDKKYGNCIEKESNNKIRSEVVE